MADKIDIVLGEVKAVRASVEKIEDRVVKIENKLAKQNGIREGKMATWKVIGISSGIPTGLIGLGKLLGVF